MCCVELTEAVRAFRPWNEQEVRDREELLRRLESGEALLTRENAAHLTASAWAVNPRRDRVLMAWHNLYGSWAWLGGHADGMTRFLDDRTVLCNRPLSSCGFEQKVKRSVRDYGLDAVDFPFVPTGRISAVGCYLNYLETEQAVFLPVFGIEQDAEAAASAQQIFSKEIVPVNIREIAQQGGCLNCISWEDHHAQ